MLQAAPLLLAQEENCAVISGSLYVTTLGHHCWPNGIPRLHTAMRLVVLDTGKGHAMPLWATLGA